ncbi:MAG: ankyrin repeat domain-containing protein [Candidatus Babeliales bacterium]|jgi:ankyrin repeat protein
MKTKIILFCSFFIISFNNATTVETSAVKTFNCKFLTCRDRVTPLMKACWERDLDTAEKLIKQGHGVNEIDYWEFLHGGTSVLGYALLGELKNVERTIDHPSSIIGSLLRAGTNPNAIINRGIILSPDMPDICVRIIPVLTFAIGRRMPAIAHQLINAGADVNVTDFFDQTTPLIVAAGLGQLDIVKSLLHAKADKKFKNCHNKTALDYAREHLQRVKEIIALLEK